MSETNWPTRTDVLVVGAGPAGASAAAWSARLGMDVLLADAAVFPRDKTCGDGLTPRAIAELNRLGLTDWILSHGTSKGLRAEGFGRQLLLHWPGGSLPDYGSAVPRTALDAKIRDIALTSGATPLEGARAVDAVRDPAGRVTGVVFEMGKARARHVVHCDRVIVADGVRSPLGRVLGRTWHRDTVYGVAGRAYVKSGRSDDPWITSHLELRDDEHKIIAGYGWIFPLADGEVNLGAGTLATAKRPSRIQVRPLIEFYADKCRADWDLGPDLRRPTSALLPMGGAVSHVAGPNWILIGDAAGCVNPLNGEGIDYGLETGRLGAELLTQHLQLDRAWPALLTAHYGRAFSIARRLANLVTVPHLLPTLGPIGMRSHTAMRIALRVMGNLVTDEDADATARLWRLAGKWSVNLDHRPPFSA